MSTVIYLANQQVQIVTGKQFNISSFTGVDAPEGSIINGMIMDFELFSEFIKELVTKKTIPTRDVSLVINSTKFVGKSIEMPKLNEKKTLQFITREYTDMGRDSDSIFGYIPLIAGKNFKRVYAESIDPEFIKEYYDLFNEAGVKLSGIYSGESELIGFTGIALGKYNKTFDFIIADATSLTTLLWVNGAFYYYNSVRCFHEPGTQEYADDIARSVSQLVQFMQANQIEYHFEKIYISGVSFDDMAMYMEAIEAVGVHTRVERFSFKTNAPQEVQSYIRGVTGLFNYDKNTNFLAKYIAYTKNTGTKKESLNKGIIGIIISFVLMVILTVVCWVLKYNRQAEYDKIYNENHNEKTLAKLEEYDEVLSRNQFLYSQFNSIDNLNKNIETYPRGNSKVLGIFDDCAYGYAILTHDSFDSEEGTITITAKADNVENINKFIKNLSERDVFKSINYTGYTYDESTGLWDIKVTCILAESAGFEMN